MAAVFEFKGGGEFLRAVPAIEQLLGEREEQHLMVIEDKPAARAWLTGYYESRDTVSGRTKRGRNFAPACDAEGYRLVTEPAVGELEDKDWKESYKEHFPRRGNSAACIGFRLGSGIASAYRWGTKSCGWILGWLSAPGITKPRGLRRGAIGGACAGTRDRGPGGGCRLWVRYSGAVGIKAGIREGRRVRQ